MGWKSTLFWSTAAATMPHSEVLQFIAGVSMINTVRQGLGGMLPKNKFTDAVFRSSFRKAATVGLMASTAVFTVGNYESGDGFQEGIIRAVGETYHHAAKPTADFIHTVGAVPEWPVARIRDGIEWISGADLTVDTGKTARTVELVEYQGLGLIEQQFQYADPDNGL